MRTKILHFKFKKKGIEQQSENCSETKKYETIFNNILNGEKIDTIPKANIRDKPIHSKNKNKIKHISKLEALNIVNDNKSNKINDEKEIVIKELDIKTKQNNNKEKNNDFKGETNNILKEKETKEKKNLQNHTKKLLGKKINVSLTQQFKSKKNKIKDFDISTANSVTTKNNISKKLKINKYNIRSSKGPAQKTLSIENTEKNDFSGKKRNKNKLKKKNEISFRPKKLSTEKNTLKQKKDLSIRKKNLFNSYKNKNNMKSLKLNQISLQKEKLNKNSQGYVNKINITDNTLRNKNRTKSKNNKLKTEKFSTKEKKLILNNTSSNININININNINDENINKKESEYVINGLNTNSLSKKNKFNNNITTVNIINNHNNIHSINNKKKMNDYHLLLFNPSNKENSSYLQKLNSKGIKIQSININLGEDLESSNYNKNNYNSYLAHNLLKDYNSNEINKEKETKSEYNHYGDLDDLWSNKSLSSYYSCKSGYTVTRKLRSLSRERDKIKLLNKCKKNESDIKLIGDKLLNIVNNFHNNNAINLKKNRKSLNEIRKLKKKNKKSKNF